MGGKQHSTCYHSGMTIGDLYQQAVGKQLPGEIMARLRFRVSNGASNAVMHPSQHLAGSLGSEDYHAVV